MNNFSFPNLLASFFCFFFGFYVYSKDKKAAVNQSFFILTFVAGFWQLGTFFVLNSPNEIIALKWCRLTYCGVVFIPIATYHFVTAFLKKSKQYKLVLLSYMIGLTIFLPLNQTPYFLNGVWSYYWGYWFKAGILHPVFIAFFSTLMMVSFLNLFFAFKNEKSIQVKARIKFLFLAFFSAYIGSVDFLPDYGIDIYPFGYINIVIFFVFIAYAVIKYRLMDIKIALTRAGIFLLLYTAVLGIPFLIGYRTKSWLWATSWAVVLATVGPFIYRRLQKKAEAILLAQQRHYQQILLHASRGMVREHDLGKLLRLMVHIVKKVVNIEYAAVFLHDDRQKMYRLFVVRDKHAIDKAVTFNEEGAFITHLIEAHEPLMVEEFPEEIQDKVLNPLNAALVIPSFTESRMIGFLLLGRKKNKSLYTEDDINVFNILSRQSALSIENCVFFKEFKEAQAKLFEAEKLASIGGMADGVAHQIKNRLNHFSIASGELKFELESFMKKNPDWMKDEKVQETFNYSLMIIESLLNNVKRTDNVVRSILNYARTTEKERDFNFFSLKEIIELSKDLLQVKHQVSTVPVQAYFDSGEQIYGIKAQIMEVIYNLLDNAYESIRSFIRQLPEEEQVKYVPMISIEVKELPESYMLSVSDNGIGIKREDQQKIFAPFFTTKSTENKETAVISGSGIGMYVVRRLIEENHNGRIWFESEYKKGATFFIELPKKSHQPTAVGV